MDKKLRVAEIAARTGLSASTVSRVLAGKANTSEKARQAVLACARELGVMQGLAAGRLLLNNLLILLRNGPSTNVQIFSTTASSRVLITRWRRMKYVCAIARWKKTTATPICFWPA